MRQFPASPIRALIDQSPRYNLGESLGPDLSVADVLDPGELASLSLGYRTSAGDAEVRTQIAKRHGIPERRTMVAPGPWFGDSAHVLRIGLAYPAGGQLEKGLEVISDALRP